MLDNTDTIETKRQTAKRLRSIGLTLKVIANTLGITKERVRQLVNTEEPTRKIKQQLTIEQKFCLNKNCNKELPLGSKKRYCCVACRPSTNKKYNYT